MRLYWLVSGLAVAAIAVAGCSEDENTGTKSSTGGASSGGASTGGSSGSTATGATGGVATGGTGATGGSGGTGASGGSGGTGGTGGSGGTPSCAPCAPDTAAFVQSGVLITQAGIGLDLGTESCTAVSGPSPNDELTLDYNTGDNTFFGSGSGYSVISLSAGTFTNETGFYTLDGLPKDTEIVLNLQSDGGGHSVEIHFTLSDSVEAEVQSTCAEFQLS